MTTYRVYSSKVAHQTIDQETILIDFDTGAYYSIDGIGSLIWEMIVKGATLKQILDFILQHYAGKPEEIEAKVIQFLQALKDESLVVIEEDQSSPTQPNDSLTPLLSAEITPFIAPTFEKYTDMQDLLLLDPIHEVDEEGWPIRQKKSEE